MVLAAIVVAMGVVFALPSVSMGQANAPPVIAYSSYPTGYVIENSALGTVPYGAVYTASDP